jgi:unsaturated rhamnogalacturonyl hydrolase
MGIMNTTTNGFKPHFTGRALLTAWLLLFAAGGVPAAETFAVTNAPARPKPASAARRAATNTVPGVTGVGMVVLSGPGVPRDAATPATTNAPGVAGSPVSTAVRDAAATAAPDATLDYEPGQAPRFWSVAAADTIMARWPDYAKAYFNAWTYVNGYELYGFELLYRATGDRKYFDYTKRYIDEFVDADGRFRGVANARGETNTPFFNNLDNMMTGNSLVMLYETTKDERYKKAADVIRRALDDYPRNDNGGFWHNKRMNGQMWIDGVFMGQMFVIRYGKSIGDSQYCWDEATKQIGLYAQLATKDDSGLLLHGFFERGHGGSVPGWADPQTGLSPEVWSEGLGWYALVLVETLADLPKDHARRAELEGIYLRLAGGLKRTQDPKSGRWFQVVDKGDRPDNWTDNSGSAMFTYTLAKGIELGLLDREEYGPVVEKGYQGIIANAKINSRGLLDIYSACDGVGVQSDYAHYIKFRKSINAKEAVAGFLWATAMVEKPRLAQLKKQ